MNTNVSSVNPAETTHDTGLSKSLLHDLALKIVNQAGELSLVDLSDRIKLSFTVVEELFRDLRGQQLCEVRGMVGPIYRIGSTAQGSSRAMDLMNQCRYVGPAPVSLETYVRVVRSQSVRSVDVHPPEVKKAFEHMVLDEAALDQLGEAVVSGRSIFLYGPSGTGKTAIAETLPNVYTDAVWIPYALEIENQIITVFDSAVHNPVAEPEAEFDRRWVRCRRPRVVVGGELTLEMLDLQANTFAKFFTAPLQLKANNGVLIIDDLGRQRIRPEELMNRWIIPLDRKVDFLTLPGGRKFEFPFELFVVFTTNMDPETLGDPAAIRRVQTKMKVEYATRPQFQEIFRRTCGAFELKYEEGVAESLIRTLADLQEPLRPCYPRDILEHIIWKARYRSVEPKVDGAAVAAACRSYLVSANV